MLYSLDVSIFFLANIKILNCLFSQIHSIAVLALLLIMAIMLGQAEHQQVQVSSSGNQGRRRLFTTVFWGPQLSYEDFSHKKSMYSKKMELKLQKITAAAKDKG